MAPELSIVIPVRNESPNIKPLYDELTQTLGQYGRSYELVIVDDGSTDDSFEQLAAESAALLRARSGASYGIATTATDAQVLANDLLQGYGADMLELRVKPPPMALALSARPVASALARLQACQCRRD